MHCLCRDGLVIGDQMMRILKKTNVEQRPQSKGMTTKHWPFNGRFIRQKLATTHAWKRPNDRFVDMRACLVRFFTVFIPHRSVVFVHAPFGPVLIRTAIPNFGSSTESQPRGGQCCMFFLLLFLFFWPAFESVLLLLLLRFVYFVSVCLRCVYAL